MLIDAREIAATNTDNGKLLAGARSMVDVKTINCGGSGGHYSRAKPETGAAVKRRQDRAVADYAGRAQQLDKEVQLHNDDDSGPFTKVYQSFGNEKRVIVPTSSRSLWRDVTRCLCHSRPLRHKTGRALLHPPKHRHRNSKRHVQAAHLPEVGSTSTSSEFPTTPRPPS